MATTASTTSSTTTTATVTCLLDEIGSSLSWASVVRVTAFLWTIPAAIVMVAGIRITFDRPPSPLATAYVDLSRAIAVVLAAFTIVIGGIWLVRSSRTLPSVGELAASPLSGACHLRFALIAALSLSGALIVDPGGLSLTLASVAAASGFVAGMLLPRWILRIDGTGRDQAVDCAAALSALIVFEVTVGWWHSMLMVDGASVLSGIVAIARGLALAAAVAAMIIGSRTSTRALGAEVS